MIKGYNTIIKVMSASILLFEYNYVQKPQCPHYLNSITIIHFSTHKTV